MKTLIAYYSLSGITQKAAARLEAITGGELFAITTAKKYGGYARAVAVAGKEFLTGEMPELTSSVDDFAAYDRILLGFPIWWGTCPRLLHTFAGQYDFQGKDVHPFCTSGSSGPARAQKELAKICAGARVHRAIRVDKQSDRELLDWLEE